VCHFLWERNEHLIVSMVGSTSSQDKHRTSDFAYKVPSASEFPMQESQQIHPIMGNDNCHFRSLLYLLFGNEDNHQQVRQLLVEFVTVNSHVLAKYCFSCSTEHVSRMKYETVFGTYLELRAAASDLQLPIYVCTWRSGSLYKYYWNYIPPHPNIDLVPPSKKFITCVPQVGHFEICHSSRCH